MLKNVLINRIRERVTKYNKNFLGIIVGDTGSAKSYSALTACEQLDPSFTMDRCAFGYAEDFMDILENQKIRRGNAVLWDEAGVGIPVTEFWSIFNRMVNFVLQTFRSNNLIVWFTVPDDSFIDPHTKKLFHMYIEAKYIDFAKSQAVLKIHELQHNRRMHKTYFPFPRVRSVDRKISIINRIRVGMPSLALRTEYEKRKKIFNEKLQIQANKTIRAQRVKQEMLQQRASITDNDVLKDIIRHPNVYTNEYNKRTYIDVDKVMTMHGVGIMRAKRIKKKAESKLNIKN